MIDKIAAIIDNLNRNSLAMPSKQAAIEILTLLKQEGWLSYIEYKQVLDELGVTNGNACDACAISYTKIGKEIPCEYILKKKGWVPPHGYDTSSGVCEVCDQLNSDKMRAHGWIHKDDLTIGLQTIREYEYDNVGEIVLPCPKGGNHKWRTDGQHSNRFCGACYESYPIDGKNTSLLQKIREQEKELEMWRNQNIKEVGVTIECPSVWSDEAKKYCTKKSCQLCDGKLTIKEQ